MRPTHHLRVFIISLAIIALALTGVLFGVRVEAVVPASGTITAREAGRSHALSSLSLSNSVFSPSVLPPVNSVVKN